MNAPFQGEQLDLLTEAERRRDEGMALVTENSNDEWVRQVDLWIHSLNRERVEWSANDLRALMLKHGDGDILEAKPQLMGARVRAAAMRKEMTRVGYTPSTLPSTHAHPIAVWRGKS